MLWSIGIYLTNSAPAVAPPPPPIDARIVELPAARSAAGPATKPQPVKQPASPPVIPKTPLSVPKPAHAQPITHNDTPSVATPAPVPTQTSPAPPKPASTPAAPPQSQNANSDSTETGTQSMGAHAIYQPNPVLPEDLRDETMHLVIVARFHIAEDGSVTVELIKSAPNPRVNQIILNTLKTWRFFPATQADKPLASTEDISISIDVGD